MLQFFAWYLTITILGLLTFPLAYRLLPALADRGYALSRSLGLLLWGFVFWLSVSLGLAQNNLGGLLLALVVLAGLVLWANWKKAENDDWRSILVWLKANRGYVFIVEVLFFLAFAAWAFVRANNPEITSAGGEKWMEAAFINAILHSPTFPPHDPWLSGYAISYYYFGYVMTAMLAQLTATPATIAHNLMLSLIFGLSAIGAYGLLYNLLQTYWRSKSVERRSGIFPTVAALLAPLFLLIVSNLEGLLESLHQAGIGWTLGTDGTFTSSFWPWLKMKNLSDVPTPPLSWIPSQFFWWWRASRVVHDYDLLGNHVEIIDEFPFFSYLLGDLHPHVLAMPFGLLVGALALHLYLGGWKGETRLFKFPKYEIKFPVWLNYFSEYEIKFPVRLEGFIFLAVALGGMAFLNTWDFPIYLALVCGALILMLVQERGWSWDLLEDFLKFSIPLAVLSIILYLPFYIGFSSQAGGIAPNVIFPTRAVYLWIMFGVLFVPLFAFLVYLRDKERANWKTGFLLAIGVTLFLWIFSTVTALIMAQTDVGQQLISSQGVSSTWDALRQATNLRLAFGGGLLTLVLLIGTAAAYLTASKAKLGEEDVRSLAGRSPLPFVMMFILVGGLLVLAPEFVYLRDQFGARMNTIFKFYYQAWALWSLAAAFAIAVMFLELRRLAALLYTTVIVVVIGAGLAYPLLSLPNKTDNFKANRVEQRTLDGAAYFASAMPDDYQAIQFMEQLDPGVVVEAVGGSYTEFARVSTYSGLPTVLGWPFHESQWRGGTSEMGTREADIRTLYSTLDWEQAQAILEQYDIRYVYIGPMERQAYPVSEDKFAKNLAKIYEQGQVVIYVVP
jgi:YYY domain-containing protein